MKKHNKALSIINLGIIIIYIIPETIMMMKWLASGILKGYAFIMMSINILIILLGLIILFLFKKKSNKYLLYWILNVITLLISSTWIVYNWNTVDFW